MTGVRRVLVTGGTGTTGSRVARLLVAQGVTPVVASRSGGGGGSGAETAAFDWSDEASTIRVLEQSRPDAVYLVAPARDPEPVDAMRPLLAAARGLGVRRAVLLGAKPVSAGDPGLGAVYDVVRDSFDEAVILRPTWFQQDFVAAHYLAAMVREGVLRTASLSGRIAYIDADDVAAVAAAALTAEVPLAGELLLTGPEALSGEETAAILSRELGRRIDAEHVSETALSDALARTLPPALAAALAHADATYTDTEPTDVVERITGRLPLSLARFVHEAHSSGVLD
ncbi:NAD-dependent epimerase/dehydratase family protein [Frondihabitans peucedani]|uniref:NAD-dependent epimerase/dehydratase family protein n=1 Tax=Frondihabitans peucedani TaxID=598626 RepID=A0ABP8E694_9MICO